MGHAGPATAASATGASVTAASVTATAVDPDHLLVRYRRVDDDYATWRLYAWGDVDASARTRWPDGQPFAGEDDYGRFAWVRLRPGATTVGLLVVDADGRKDVEIDRVVDPDRYPEIWLRQGDPTVYLSRPPATGDAPEAPAGSMAAGTTAPGTTAAGAAVAGTTAAGAKAAGTTAAGTTAAGREAVLHYRRADGDYRGWGLHVWTGAATPTAWDEPLLAERSDAFGAVYRVPLLGRADTLRYLLHRGATKDTPGDQTLQLYGVREEAWLLAGHQQPLLQASTTATRADPAALDAARAQWIDRGTVAWRTGPTGGRRYALVCAPDGGARITGGDLRVPPGGEYWEIELSPRRGGLTAEQRRRYPHLRHHTGFALTGTPEQAPTRTTDVAGGPAAGAVGGPATGVVGGPAAGGVGDPADVLVPGAVDRDLIARMLRGQLIAVERDSDGRISRATGVQTAGVLDDVYAAATAARLGVTLHDGCPTIAVWAPTARSVAVELSGGQPGDGQAGDGQAGDGQAGGGRADDGRADDGQPGGDAQPAVVPAIRDDDTGVWRVTGARSWIGRYYRLRIVGYQPATGAVETVRVTDPYSVSLSTDSRHSQIIDFDDPTLTPEGWHAPRGRQVAGADSAGQQRVQVHELSVRDFSIADETVPAEHRGTYLAFTHSGSRGMVRLRELARAGLTHVQVMPVYDFVGVPDRRADQLSVTRDLTSLPPDSPQQQEEVARVADADGYDWGYAPLHLTAPEGSYATDPCGPARVRQLREMIMSLERIGLGVVLDVAYNHMAAAGRHPHSVLDVIVPGYYHRRLDDGTVATSTGGANTAPEHAMMGKLVVDSVVTWARRYRVRGFRFDYMGHHPKANLLAVRAALNELTVAADGIDGASIVLWGEGWNAGEVANDVRFVQATQANLAGTGIATFNDRLRDAVRGGGPWEHNPRVQGFASGLYTDPNGDPVNGPPAEQRARLLHYQDLIQLGLAGNLAGYRFVDSGGRLVAGVQVEYNGSPAGYAASPAENVNYVDAHDNEILYDALAYKLPPTTSPADRARMQLLALSFTVLGQGVGFVVAGSDRMRSKSLDANSYRSGDWFNAMLDPRLGNGNGFGRGLPLRQDNGARWRFAEPLLADPALVPDADTMIDIGRRYEELLRIRTGCPLFWLPTAEEVRRRVSFPLSGDSATAGVITMHINGSVGERRLDGVVAERRLDSVVAERRLDSDVRSVVVVFNAVPSRTTQTVTGLAGARIALHPVLAGSVDPVVRTASFEPATGALTVPARTVAVFVEQG